MNPTSHQDLSELLSHLTSILTSQNLLHTPIDALPRVLPASIPRLPDTLSTLPPTPASNPLETISDLLKSHVLPYLTLSSLSSRYYGFVIGGATPAALLADTLVSVYDQNVMVHLPQESVTTILERAALGLLVQLFRLGPEWEGAGTLTTGATASNLLGLAVGREWVLRRAIEKETGDKLEGKVSTADVGLVGACEMAGRVRGIKVLSSMPHSSVAKVAGVVGIGRMNVVDVGGGDGVGVDVDRFERVADELLADRWLCILVVSAGEVNTGRFATDGWDMMKKLREFCDRSGIWIHVDAAFGLFGRVLVEDDDDEASPGRAIEGYERVVRGTEGIELADSITGDGHKLLNVPYDCGLFFTRHRTLSEEVFSNGSAAYLKATASEDEGPRIHSPLNIGIENSRRFRALPVWATLMAYGRQGYVDMLQRQIGLARRLVAWMWDFDGLEVLPKCADKEEALAQTFIVVLFRATDDTVNEGLVKQINATGKMYVGGTQWDAASAARIAISNWQVDVDRDAAVIQEVLSKIIR